MHCITLAPGLHLTSLPFIVPTQSLSPFHSSRPAIPNTSKRDIDNHLLRVIYFNAPITDNISIIQLASNHSENKVGMDAIVKVDNSPIRFIHSNAPLIAKHHHIEYVHLPEVSTSDNLHSNWYGFLLEYGPLSCPISINELSIYLFST